MCSRKKTLWKLIPIGSRKFQELWTGHAQKQAKAGVVLEAESEAVDVPYRQLVGSLMYLAVDTRLELAFAVAQLTKFLQF